MDGLGHAGAGFGAAESPSAGRCGLGEAVYDLAGADIEPAGAFDGIEESGIGFLAGDHEFFAGKGREADGADKGFGVVAKSTEEVDEIAVEVVVGFDGRGSTIEKDGGRATERFAIVVGGGKEGEEPFEMGKFAAVPPKGDELFVRGGMAWGKKCGRGWLGGHGDDDDSLDRMKIGKRKRNDRGNYSIGCAQGWCRFLQFFT